MGQWRNQRGNQKTSGEMKIKTQLSKIYVTLKSGSKREVYSNIGLPQKERKISNKQPNLLSKGIKEQTKPKVNRKKK